MGVTLYCGKCRKLLPMNELSVHNVEGVEMWLCSTCGKNAGDDRPTKKT